jgi:hypothetical protein
MTSRLLAAVLAAAGLSFAGFANASTETESTQPPAEQSVVPAPDAHAAAAMVVASGPTTAPETESGSGSSS